MSYNCDECEYKDIWYWHLTNDSEEHCKIYCDDYFYKANDGKITCPDFKKE